MPLNSSSADLGNSSRRASVEMARDLLGASGAGKIADAEGNTWDPVGSSQGPRESFLKTVGDNVKEKVNSMIGEKALDPAAAEELQQKNPGAMNFLQSTSGAVLEMMIFLTYVGLDMGKSIFNGVVMRGDFSSEPSHSHPNGQAHKIVYSALLVNVGFLQLTLALITIAVLEGKEGFKALASPARYRKFALVSFLFSIATNCSTLAYTVLSPGTIKILGQCRLLETAVLSKIIFNRRYTETQWMLMIIIIFGATLHLMAKSDAKSLFTANDNLAKSHDQRRLCHFNLTHLPLNASRDPTNASLVPMPLECVLDEHDDPEETGAIALGLVYTFMYMLCSDIASIVSEMFLKSEKNTPFYIQKATMESMGLPFLFIFSFITPWFSSVLGVEPKRWAQQMWWATEGSTFMNADAALAWCNDPTEHHDLNAPVLCGMAAGGFWRDWGYWQPWGAVFFTACQSWFAGILVKLMSSVVKLLAKIVSLGGVFFIGDAWLLYSPGDGDLTAAAVAAVQIILLTFTFLQIKVPKEDEGSAKGPDRPADPPSSAPGVELPDRARAV